MCILSLLGQQCLLQRRCLLLKHPAHTGAHLPIQLSLQIGSRPAAEHVYVQVRRRAGTHVASSHPAAVQRTRT